MASIKRTLGKAVEDVILWCRSSTDSESVEEILGTEGATHSRPIPGPQTQGRNRFLDIASGTREKVEWPSGANITELTIFADLSAAQITAGSQGVYLRIAIDSASDAIANALLTRASSETDDAGWIPVPIGQIVRIPLTDALSEGSLGGGRVDVLTDEGQALDVWIGGN